MRTMETEKRMSIELFIERVLSSITVLGLILLCVGIPLHIIGRVYDVLVIAQVGAWILLIGIALIGMRILYWILEQIVESG